MSDPIEAAARALHQVECDISGVPVRWDDISPDSQAVFWIQAKVAVDAYEAALWRPIGECPSDGRQVLVTGGIRHQHMVDCAPADGAWWRAMKRDLRAVPTHFRPLPDAPKAITAIAALPLEEMP